MARTELFVRKAAGGMFSVVNQSLTTGNIYFVNSATGTNSVGNGQNPDAPFATLAYAVGRVTANQGDRIYVMPGHTETVSDATTLAPAIAGVQIIGLGQGTARPTITLDTGITASIAVSAANVSFENIVFVANFLAIAACFTVSAAEFQIRGCLFKDTSSVLNFLTIIGIGAGANTADGLTFNDNVVINLGVTSNNTTINTGSTIDRLQALRNNLKWAVQNDKPILIDVTTGILTNADIGFNKGYRPNTTTAGGSLIKCGGTTSTGWVYNNFVQTLTTSTDLLFTTSIGLAAFENRVTGVVGATGFVIPAVDS